MDLAALGSHLNGLALFDRAVALWSELAGADPAERPGLAAALMGRGVLLAELERHTDAAAAFAAAAQVYGRLGSAHTSALAGALTAQAAVNADAGRLGEATSLMRVACELREQLHNADPLDPRLRRELAAGLRSLARLLERGGEEDAAREAALRARYLSR
jgi:hypothetical protein